MNETPSPDTQEIARLKAELRKAETTIEGYRNTVHIFTEHEARLKAELAQVKMERDNWHELVKDHCHSDDEFRKVAGSWDGSDSYGVEPHADILEKVLVSLAQATQREQRLRGLCASLVLSILESIHVGGIDLEARALDIQQALTETKEGG